MDSTVVSTAATASAADVGAARDSSSDRLRPYVHLTPARASTSSISTGSSPPSLAAPSLSPVRNHSAVSLPLVTPVEEAHDPLTLSPNAGEKLAPIYRGRFIELIEEDWEFRDEDATLERDESFEIVAFPRASVSSERTTSTSQSEAYKALPFIRRHVTKEQKISPSFSTSRLLATLGRKSKEFWESRKDLSANEARPSLFEIPGGVAIVDELGVTRAPLTSIEETGSPHPADAIAESEPVADLAPPDLQRTESGRNFLGKRLSLRRRRP